MLELIWEPEALDQRDAILEYIAERNAEAAERLQRAIRERLELTRKFPQIGRPGRLEGTREAIIHPNYLVIYRVTETAIDVLRVLHARQQYP